MQDLPKRNGSLPTRWQLLLTCNHIGAYNNATNRLRVMGIRSMRWSKVEMEEVFKALSDASRRRLLDSLHERGGQSLRELSAGLAMTRQAVSKHLRILEEANLVTTVWRGREKLHFLNAAPINEIAERWISKYDEERVRALTDLKRALEDTPMTDAKTSFVYTTYIKTTPERLWQALTDPAFTRRYWGNEFETDWNVGSQYTWIQDGMTMSDPEQVILEAEPGRRLSYTWLTTGREALEHWGFAPEDIEAVLNEPRTHVVFNIEPMGEVVKLTVIHGEFAPDSVTLKSISGGWPAIISGLKTLLETDEVLPQGSAGAPAS